MQNLSWDLDGLNVDMLVAPGIVDVAGPRMALRPVEGLPLLHIEKPQYGASQSILKSTLDLAVASFVLLMVAPVMFVTACAIKLHDGGPVFFRHARVGKDGREFRVWKFRSMVQNADARKAALQVAAQDGSRAVFFKSEDDPRITPIGRFIRKTSIDELPQLFNVLSRDMSVVGPRPLVPGEGSEVPNFVERRLLVKPGITGLWQVSGRSDLPEEDRIRLDLLYVENWSLMQDVMILWRTVRVVLTSQGAY
jgi:exopolysaccharide biosynthesis polyprenyl glycosylphosphotransferase